MRTRLIALLCTIACSCVGIQKDFPEKRSYVVDVQRPGAGRSPLPGTALTVGRLEVSDAFRGKAFVYRQNEHSFEADFHNEHFAAPDALITQELRAWLREARVFEEVLTPQSRVAPTHVLEGELVSIYGDYAGPGEAAAVLETRFFLLDPIEVPAKVLASLSYPVRVELEGSDTEALVNGWNRALSRTLRALEGDLASALGG